MLERAKITNNAKINPSFCLVMQMLSLLIVSASRLWSSHGSHWT